MVNRKNEEMKIKYLIAHLFLIAYPQVNTAAVLHKSLLVIWYNY